jgi:hypothetical protein
MSKFQKLLTLLGSISNQIKKEQNGKQFKIQNNEGLELVGTFTI